MPRSIRCVVVNETEHDLIPTKDPLEFKLERGTLDGAPSPPTTIKARKQAEFTTSSPTDQCPAGWVNYKLHAPDLVVKIVWGDLGSSPEACRIEEYRSPNSKGERVDVPVVISDLAGQPLAPDQAAAESALVATYTVRITMVDIVTGAGTREPASIVQTMPDGTTRVLAPGPIRRWDDARMSQRRKKLLAILGREFPMAFKAVGQAAPRNQGIYRPLTCWSATSKGTSCTAVNAAMKTLAKADGGASWAFDIFTSPAWVPYRKGRLPNVGDIYTLYTDAIAPKDDPPSPCQRHVGFVVQVPTSTSEHWVTADGGQRDSASAQAAHLVVRPWEWRRPPVHDKYHEFAKPTPDLDYPYLGGGAEAAGMAFAGRLFGWLDMGHPSIKFAREEFDDEKYYSPKILGKYTESHYKDLGKRIRTVLEWQG